MKDFYVLPYNTTKDIKKAEKILNKLYNHFEFVKAYPHGICEGSTYVKIIAKKPITN